MSRAAFASRRAVKTHHAVRADWFEAVRLALVVSRDAKRAGEGADEQTLHLPGATISQLMVALRDLTPENFPAPVGSLRTMAGAFLHLARAFVDPRFGPEARTVCASFLMAGAEALDWALTDLRTQQSQVWRGQLGERD